MINLQIAKYRQYEKGTSIDMIVNKIQERIFSKYYVM